MNNLKLKKGVHCIKCPYCKELFVSNIKNEMPVKCPHCDNVIEIRLEDDK